MGNTQSIPAFSELSAGPKSLAESPCPIVRYCPNERIVSSTNSILTRALSVNQIIGYVKNRKGENEAEKAGAVCPGLSDILPAAGRIRDFHPLERAHTGQTGPVCFTIGIFFVLIGLVQQFDKKQAPSKNRFWGWAKTTKAQKGII
ncbi:MAG: hypothetical protein MR828_08895 [Clostridiales bacterium]|nr:hypothetical protein [Clostridiales bacterium]